MADGKKARARATAVASDEEGQVGTELLFIAFPADVYKKLFDAAAAREMTFAQGLAKAVQDFIDAEE